MDAPLITVRLIFKDRIVPFTGTLWEVLQQVANARLDKDFITDALVGAEK